MLWYSSYLNTVWIERPHIMAVGMPASDNIDLSEVKRVSSRNQRNWCRFSWFTGKPSISARISGTSLQDHRNFAWFGENSSPILANFNPRKPRRPLPAQKPLVGH